ncbi:glycosyltransferase family 2 protein [Vibrio sonorensis]|uniref:glycosyltransferase family 2 protein n=1 Tax=Vibrio sonorensis TaxID=1004316 RepID=UPI001113A5C6|nr:glycosyltransferase family A protein [Vibrio sonorensis]
MEINIINNHSDFHLDSNYIDIVNVLHNDLRPDFSTGHLARNWNQAILHGFRDLSNPRSDIVVTVQDDVLFKPDWLDKLKELHKKYSFITMGAGDTFCSYLPEAVRKIGMWDERFCNIGFQEADYFLRALIYNREKSSINDIAHGRELNVVGSNEVYDYNSRRFESDEEIDRVDSELITIPFTNLDRRNAALDSMKFHCISSYLFEDKWGIIAAPWNDEHHILQGPISSNYVTYPYFEKNVENLKAKNFVIPEGWGIITSEELTEDREGQDTRMISVQPTEVASVGVSEHSPTKEVRGSEYVVSTLVNKKTWWKKFIGFGKST